MQVNRPLRPVQEHQPVRTANLSVPAPSEQIKVKTRSSERMQELQQAVTQKGQNTLGSKAQTALIKARIEAVPVSGILDQAQKAPMSKWQIAGRVLGGLLTAGISEIVINRHAIKSAITGVPTKVGRSYDNFANNLDYSVGQRYTDAGQRALAKADRLDSLIRGMTDQARLEQQVGGLNNQIRLLQGGPQTDQTRQQLSSLTEQQQTSQGELNRVNQQLQTARQEFGDGNLQALRQQMNELRTQGREALEIGRDIQGGRLEMAEKYGSKNLLKIASLGHGVFSLLNSVAIVKTAVESGSNLLSLAQTTKEAASASIGVTQNAVGIAAVAAAPVTILLEGRELYQTAKALQGALSKVEKANALLSPESRQALRTQLTQQLHKAENGGWISKPDPAKATALRAKIAALDALPPAGQVSDDVKAMATQIKKHADVAHKSATVIKNTVAITAGVLTIAAFAMGPAAPVGLALAATVLGVGAAIYGISLLVKKYRTGSQRQNQINTLTNNHAQIEQKRSSLTAEKAQIAQKTQELTARKDLHTARTQLIQQYQRDHQLPSAESLARFQDLAPPLTARQLETNDVGTHLSTSQAAIAQGITPQLEALGQRNAAIDEHLGTLATLQRQNTLELLACSPHDAAARIYDGAIAGNESMKYLASEVLGVNVTNLPPEVAKEQLARGMSLNPEQ